MNKLFKPLFGYDSPRGKCKRSDFAGGYHRLVWFPMFYDDDGLPGYSLMKRCVNCGKFMGGGIFEPGPRIKEADEQIEKYKKEV